MRARRAASARGIAFDVELTVRKRGSERGRGKRDHRMHLGDGDVLGARRREGFGAERASAMKDGHGAMPDEATRDELGRARGDVAIAHRDDDDRGVDAPPREAATGRAKRHLASQRRFSARARLRADLAGAVDEDGPGAAQPRFTHKAHAPRCTRAPSAARRRGRRRCAPRRGRRGLRCSRSPARAADRRRAPTRLPRSRDGRARAAARSRRCDRSDATSAGPARRRRRRGGEATSRDASMRGASMVRSVLLSPSSSRSTVETSTPGR